MYWPYRIPVKEAAKVTLVVCAGCAAGGYAVDCHYRPLKDFDERLEKGKIELLRKYKDIYKNGSASTERDEQLYKNSPWIGRLGLRPLDQWKCVTMKDHQGLYILTDIIEDSHHLRWFDRCVNNYAEPPGFTNVHLHFPDARNIFQGYRKKLRWTTLGFHYNWDTKLYPNEGKPLPLELVSFGDLVSRILGIGPFHPDAALINFFPASGKLGPHTDHSERDLSNPLLSLSLGQSAVYLTGGNDLDSPVVPLLLHSGDALVMHGGQRLVYHAVPSIRITRNFELPDGVNSDVRDYANNHRISLTLRQVEPEGLCINH